MFDCRPPGSSWFVHCTAELWFRPSLTATLDCRELRADSESPRKSGIWNLQPGMTSRKELFVASPDSGRSLTRGFARGPTSGRTRGVAHRPTHDSAHSPTRGPGHRGPRSGHRDAGRGFPHLTSLGRCSGLHRGRHHEVAHRTSFHHRAGLHHGTFRGIGHVGRYDLPHGVGFVPWFVLVFVPGACAQPCKSMLRSQFWPRAPGKVCPEGLRPQAGAGAVANPHRNHRPHPSLASRSSPIIPLSSLAVLNPQLVTRNS